MRSTCVDPEKSVLSVALAWVIVLCSSVQLQAQTPDQLKSWLPDIDGWAKAEAAEVFDAENLFDRINGAAPLFIENNFREMTSMEYTKGEQYITVQAYRHASPVDAFGMYASERSSDLAYLKIGGEAQGDEKNLYFFSGPVYVKMWTNSSEATEALLTVGKTLADRIDPNAGYPPILKLFPEEGKRPHSESYITSSYIGHDFLKAVYLANYTDEAGKSFQLFVVDGHSAEGARGVLTHYFTFTKQPLTFQEGELTIEDRYNGVIPVCWKGQYIIGVYSESGDTVGQASGLIRQLADKL